jgi:hypothetical protein
MAILHSFLGSIRAAAIVRPGLGLIGAATSFVRRGRIPDVPLNWRLA